MPLVEIQGLTFSYDGKLDVLSEIDFSLAEGQSLLVVGDNGSGKSTLGRLLAGILNPTAGTITVAGEKPCEVRVSKRCRVASYMGQVSHLSVLTSTIASELISFSNGTEQSALEEAYKEWANRYSLPGDTSINPRDLTTPDLWRLVLGFYAVVLQPTLLVVDEVFCPGNTQQQECAQDVLKRRRQQGKATIFLYQRRLPLPFDLTATLENCKLSFLNV
jgi:ABC-type multidrug transport system ATPase subunit